MDIAIRPARHTDIPFIAWVQQEAARSHLPIGFWDIAFPGDEAERLRMIGRIADARARSFCHWSGFLIAEWNGQVAAALSAYTQPSIAAGSALFEAMFEAFDAAQWSGEERQALNERLLPFLTCMPDTAEDAWVVEWVATKPEFRGRGVVRALLHAVLELGASRQHAHAQIAILIGNIPAQRAYESAGFRVFDEKTNPDFERLVGSPGIRRLLHPAPLP